MARYSNLNTTPLHKTGANGVLDTKHIPHLADHSVAYILPANNHMLPLLSLNRFCIMFPFSYCLQHFTGDSSLQHLTCIHLLYIQVLTVSSMMTFLLSLRTIFVISVIKLNTCESPALVLLCDMVVVLS